jgi:hypothetical protein
MLSILTNRAVNPPCPLSPAHQRGSGHPTPNPRLKQRTTTLSPPQQSRALTLSQSPKPNEKTPDSLPGVGCKPYCMGRLDGGRQAPRIERASKHSLPWVERVGHRRNMLMGNDLLHVVLAGLLTARLISLGERERFAVKTSLQRGWLLTRLY